MPVRPRESAPAWIHRRRCLYCGEDGKAIQAGGHAPAFRCPRCMGDLYSRPPRSYAELEGLELPKPDAANARPLGAAAANSARKRGVFHAVLRLVRSVTACVRWVMAIHRGDRASALGLNRSTPRPPVKHG